MRCARIEAAIGAARQARDLAKSLFGDGIVAFLEHEGGHAEKPERAGGVTKIVELFLHGVADENQGLHLGGLGFARGVGDDLADLGMAAAAVDPLHQRAQPLGLRDPRSEEHTSELQSLRHLVCRLLLEKKKKQKTSNSLHTNEHKQQGSL